MGNLFYFPWEVSRIEWLQATLPPAVMTVVSQFSLLGEQLTLIAVIGFLYWCLDKELGKRVGRSILVVNLWGPMIKNAALRLRPYYASDRIALLRKIDADADVWNVGAQGYSMPSGHCANTAAACCSVASQVRKKALWAAAFVLPLLVGVSRVAVGAHYPTDVFAGWALGIAAVLLTAFLRRVTKSDALFSAILLLTALPGLFYCNSNDYFTGLGLLIGFLAAEPFEKRFVRFENTRVWWRCILRLLGGVAVYLAANYLLKLPFPATFLESGTTAAQLVRTARYAVVAFLDLSIYPLVFRKSK